MSNLNFLCGSIKVGRVTPCAPFRVLPTSGAHGVTRPTSNFLCGFNFDGCYNLKMTSDPELLRQFARTNSEAAFAELAQRHVNLVYSAALRQANGDEHLAKDVAQM